jgi:hypothetical protein
MKCLNKEDILVSRERELLKEFIDFVDSYEFYPTERNIIFEIVNRANAILAKPEQEPVAWMNDSGGCFLSDGNKYSENWTALYTEEKREPLSDSITADMYHANKKATHPDSYWAGVYDAEKAHGIGEG